MSDTASKNATQLIQNKVRIVTATSLFDGHDAAINVMRRILQASGAEVIHLGHNRSVQEIVDCAIQEDAHAVAITSYQGGHNEYFKYMRDLLNERGYAHVQIFGGGGGVILPDEVEALHRYGIARIYTPDDGRELGLQGMIDDLIARASYSIYEQSSPTELDELTPHNSAALGRLISIAEAGDDLPQHRGLMDEIQKRATQIKTPILGITGTGGAGKSSLVDELVRRFSLGFSRS